MQNEYEDEDFQDPEADREWLESSLSELQQEGRVQQRVNAEQINQMLRIQAKSGYGLAFDLISEHFPSLVTAYGREHLDGFISDFDAPPDESDLGYGPLSSSALHFDCDGVDQNAFRFYSNKDSEDNCIIHVIHKESGKKDSISGRNLESVMKQAVASGLGLHFQYELEKIQNILHDALEQKSEIDYQICLRTLYEFFVADKGNALSAVVFNGWVEFVDKATGQDRKGCLLSIQVTKEEFQKLNLTRVEPKACFKALKGIANSALHSFTPVEPVLKINREETKKVVGKI